MGWIDFGWGDRPSELKPLPGETPAQLELRIAAYQAAHPGELKDLEDSTLEAFGEHIYNKALADAGVGGTVPDADATTKGKVQLAGDLTGTAASPQIAASAVGTAEIAAGAVTAAKVAADVATQAGLTAEIAARGTAVSGEVTARNAAIAAHEADTTSVHGIADTTALVLTSDGRLKGRFRGAWQATTFYAANDLVTNGGTLWSANADFTSGGSFNAANWTSVSAGSGSADFRTDTVGNLGATHTSTLGTEFWLTTVGTLNANHIETIAGRAGGKLVLLRLQQDATGGRTLQVSDGTTPTAVTINSAANAVTDILVICKDATDFDVFVFGAAGGEPTLAISGTTGNLGATSTVDFASVARERWLAGTLNANHAVTVNNPVAGSRLRFIAVQDATGGRTLTIAGQAVTIPTTPSTGVVMVYAVWLDATTFRVESAGVETDPLAVLKSSFAAKGSIQVATAAGTPADQAVGANGTLWVPDSTQANGWAFKTLSAAGVEATANRGAASGYAPLNASSRVPIANLASGTPDGTKFIRDDGTLAAPGGAAGLGGTIPFVAGYLYLPSIQIGGSNIPSTNGIVHAIDFVPGRSCTIDGAKVRVNTLATTGGAYRVAIYTDNNGIPGTLVDDSATVAVDAATGVVSLTGLSAAVTAGARYWLAGVQQGAPATPATFQGQSAGGPLHPAIPADPTNLTIGTQIQWSTSVTGAFPSSGGATSDWGPGAQRVAIGISASA